MTLLMSPEISCLSDLYAQAIYQFKAFDHHLVLIHYWMHVSLICRILSSDCLRSIVLNDVTIPFIVGLITIDALH